MTELLHKLETTTSGRTSDPVHVDSQSKFLSCIDVDLDTRIDYMDMDGYG